MSFSFPFSVFVIPPAVFCFLDVGLLSFLGPATKQNYELVTITAKINPVSRPESDTPFGHALPYGLHIAKIADLDPCECSAYFQGGPHIKVVEPLIEWCFTFLCNIDNELNYVVRMVTYRLLYVNYV
jgi:hypothetical protein